MPFHAFASSVAVLVVSLAGIFLVLLGVAALLAPSRAKAFLLGFAATPQRHYIELVVRATVGLAFIVASSRLPWPQFFYIAGALLVGTTAVMAVLPYRLHRAFAGQAVPRALAYLPLIALASLLAGSVVVWSAHVASAA